MLLKDTFCILFIELYTYISITCNRKLGCYYQGLSIVFFFSSYMNIRMREREEKSFIIEALLQRIKAS